MLSCDRDLPLVRVERVTLESPDGEVARNDTMTRYLWLKRVLPQCSPDCESDQFPSTSGEDVEPAWGELWIALAMMPYVVTRPAGIVRRKSYTCAVHSATRPFERRERRAFHWCGLSLQRARSSTVVGYLPVISESRSDGTCGQIGSDHDGHFAGAEWVRVHRHGAVPRATARKRDRAPRARLLVRVCLGPR